MSIFGKNILCIIPARGGSKGIPNKNIKLLCGFPLIYYSIKAAKESKICDRIIVSTDSDKIANISAIYGGEIPFLRPPEYSTDNSLVEDTIFHVLKWIEKNDNKYDYVLILQPTSPLILPRDIEVCADMLIEKNAEMIVSISESPINLGWVGSIDEQGSMKGFLRNNIYRTRRQDFKTMYILSGSIYLAKWDIFYNKKDYYQHNTYAYVLPRERAIDIDSLFDFKLAEYLLNYKNNE